MSATDDRDFAGLPETMMFGDRFKDYNCPICGLKFLHGIEAGCVVMMRKYLNLVQGQVVGQEKQVALHKAMVTEQTTIHAPQQTQTLE